MIFASLGTVAFRHLIFWNFAYLQSRFSFVKLLGVNGNRKARHLFRGGRFKGVRLPPGERSAALSRRKWTETLTKYEEQHLRGSVRPLTELGIPFWDANERALRLFREGGFATLDEFCKLAGPQFQMR